MKLDTNLADFHNYNPAYNNSISNTCLGNLGQESVSNQINLRLLNSNFFFLKPFDLYYSNLVKHFNTRKPFTMLNYSSGGNKEYSLDIIHTQNVNKNFNIGLNYQLLNSIGQYLRQTTKNFSILFFTSFSNHRYSFHSDLNLIRVNLHQSGGITNDAFVTDSLNWDPAGMTVWLNNAFSKINSTSLNFSQELKIGRAKTTYVSDTIPVKSLKSKFSLLHEINLETDNRIYTEQNADSLFYDILYRLDATKDSVNLINYRNFLGIRIGDKQTDKVGLIAGLECDFRKYFNSYYYFYATDTQFYSNFLKTSVFYSNSGDFNIGFVAQYGLTGYYSGDILSSLSFRKIFNSDTSFLFSEIKFISSKPDFIEQNCISNHFIRNTILSDKQTTSFDLGYVHGPSNLSLGINYFVLDNFVYFDENKSLVQETSTFSAFMIYVKKNFTLGKFHLDNSAFYQESGNQMALSIPKILLKHSFFWKFPVTFKVSGGYLDLMAGLEVRYHSNFYAMGYDPALGSFYNQQDKLLGNYPFTDLFVNVKLKRARFFLKMEHLNYGLLNPNYFLAFHYPANIRVFRFGISWTFYD